MAMDGIIKKTLKLIASTVAIVLGSLAPLYVPSGADAVTFSISGKLKQFCCNWPNGGAPSFFTPKTNPTLGGGTPVPAINSFPFAGGGGGADIRDGTVVGVFGTLGGKLTFPAKAIKGVGSYTTGPTPPPVIPGWITLQTALNFENDAGILMPGGQTGTASYCLNYAGNPNCTDPALGTYAGTTVNARLSFVAGPNQFGGTMRILGGTPGFLRRFDGAGMTRIRLGYFAAPLTQIGGPFSEYQPETNTAFFWPATLPATNTATATSTSLANVIFAGIPWGTGTVYAGRTGGTGGIPTQSISGAGSDARTPTSGIGPLSLVAASVAAAAGAGNPFPILVKLELNVPEPGTNVMLVCGVGLLGFFAIRRRRLRMGA